MKTVRYSQIILWLGVLLGGAGTWQFSSFVMSDFGGSKWEGLLIVSFFAIIGLLSIIMLVGDRVALRYDSRSVEIRLPYRYRRMAWSEIETIRIRTIDQYAMHGLIKTASHKTLIVTLKEGAFGFRSFSLHAFYLGVSAPELVRIAAEMEEFQNAAAPVGHPSAGFRAPTEGYRPAPTASEGGGFDPDAALARYMERKQRGDPPGVPMLDGKPLGDKGVAPRPPLPGFGRKGL